MEKKGEKFLSITWTFEGNKCLIEHQSNDLTVGEILGLLELEKLRVYRLDNGDLLQMYVERKDEEKHA